MPVFLPVCFCDIEIEGVTVYKMMQSTQVVVKIKSSKTELQPITLFKCIQNPVVQSTALKDPYQKGVVLFNCLPQELLIF